MEAKIGRSLALWKFGVSHAHLLLRAPADSLHDERLSILLKGVRHIDLPTRFECEKAVWEEPDGFKSIEIVFYAADDRQYSVTASAIFIEVDQRNHTDPVEGWDDQFCFP